jgi:DNA replication protein DnaC
VTLADLVGALAKAEREGALREKIRFFCRFALLIVDEIGYLPVIPGVGNLFFQLVNARYEKGTLILTSNRGFAEWGEVFGEPSTAGCRHCRRGRVSHHGHGSASRPLRAAAAARVALLRARPGLCCY